MNIVEKTEIVVDARRHNDEVMFEVFVDSLRMGDYGNVKLSRDNIIDLFVRAGATRDEVTAWLEVMDPLPED